MKHKSSVLYPDWTSYIEKQPLRGRDTLGLDSVAVSIGESGILNKLIYGLTGATNRARYFSLMPWIVWKFTRSTVKKTASEQRKFIKCVEMLFIYCSHQHSIDKPKVDHTGLIGKLTATKQYKKRTKILTLYNEKKEFKKRVSAFDAPFYEPSLEKMRITHRDDMTGCLKLSREIGEKLALALDNELKKHRCYKYLDNLGQNSINYSIVKTLSKWFCICSIRYEDALDRLEIIRLLFGQFNHLVNDERQINRAKSLTLFLDIIAQHDNNGIRKDEITRMFYFGTYANGKIYSPSSCLNTLSLGWRLFELRRHQQYALESIWYAVLKEIERYRSIKQSVTADSLIGYFSHSLIEHKLFKNIVSYDGRTFDINRFTLLDFINALGKYINQGFQNINTLDDNHIAKQCSDFMANYSGIKSSINEYTILADIDKALYTNCLDCGILGLVLLIIAFLRNLYLVMFSNNHFVQILSKEGYMSGISLKEYFKEICDLSNVTLYDFFRSLLEKWILKQHYSTAIRRLFASSNNNFKIVFTESGIDLIEDINFDEITPHRVSSRMNAIMRLLIDLGLIAISDQKYYFLTKDGANLRKEMLNRFES